MNLSCDTCMHGQVCKHKTEMEQVKRAVDCLAIVDSIEEKSHMKLVSEITWLDPIQVKCSDYLRVCNMRQSNVFMAVNGKEVPTE